ncbi:AgmX/PglI C-terminal domain-containing protein [Myxococcus stipitatus]|uniref:AgmX/PglI C-terminal domain-containing protein n=1 Tax=Myxococcus stipitatus TaxID=83455 RepID=UPI0030D3934B
MDTAHVGAVQEMTFEDSSSLEDSATAAQDEAVDEESAAESELDEEFARELGFADEAANEDTEPTAARTVYVPPELGEKEHLTADDIQQVVVANQPAITECLREHAADSLLEKGGHFVVSWSVQPGGETTDVAMDTPALRSTPVARCIEGVVRGWKFPMHAVRMPAPIHFPFVF